VKSCSFEDSLTQPKNLRLQARLCEPGECRGRNALKLDGLALLPDLQCGDATVEVDICAEQAAYAGIAFRATDSLNHELAYAVPHCTGLWDALQYDPVFRGSNTWQLYHGEGYQRSAAVPTGTCFT
jgi:hypothetical protein